MKNSSEKVAVAISGGVDSSVAAYLIHEKYENAVGIHLLLTDSMYSDVEDAKMICEKFSMPFYLLDLREEFKRSVISDFISSYEKGLTPNPCVVCNKMIKFGKLLEYAEELGCSKFATGHYARIAENTERGIFELWRACDRRKDQSYMLHLLTQKQLSKVLFPLGEKTKDETRALAEKLGLSNAKKRDSQDICFVPDGDYARFIEIATKKDYPNGDFTDRDGVILGKHKGIIRYTVGQRKGLGLALPRPMYVIKKDVENNRVILGYDEDLFLQKLTVCDVNFISGDSYENFECHAKTRYSQKETEANVMKKGENTYEVCFKEPQRAPTPGQSCVFYSDERVIGGGRIL